MSLVINFDPKLMNLNDAAEGGLTRQFGEKAPFLKNIDNNSGVCTLGFQPAAGPGRQGRGGSGDADVRIERAGRGDDRRGQRDGHGRVRRECQSDGRPVPRRHPAIEFFFILFPDSRQGNTAREMPQVPGR